VNKNVADLSTFKLLVIMLTEVLEGRVLQGKQHLIGRRRTL